MTAAPAPYEPFDPEYTASVVEEVFGPIVRHYFRAELLGAEKLPAHGPLILAPNHSGNAFPYDGMVLDGLLWQRDGLRGEAKLRSVFEKELAVTWWMRPFGLDNFWRRCGGIDLTFDNFDRLLARGERLIYYPEGVPGIGKGFFRRYQLQRYSTSFVLLAARHGAAVYPVSIVNAEWVIPFCFTVPALDRLMQRLFRVPFLPLPAAPLALLFPWMWYLTLPARMIFVVGEPLDMAARLRAAGIDLDDPDRAKLREVAEGVRRDCQGELDRQVAVHGRRPYEGKSLRRELWAARRRLLSLLPCGWPVSFVRHDRDRRRPPARHRLHALLRDWDLLGFYLPFGWPLLGLTRRLRSPPCGYRGLSHAERRAREGTFHWHLRDRPLPQRAAAE
ncbi:MAG TPA: 1-acyl-sn-glycerol-3-phosphate acyltransferase [Thermoanaerobaculia bacterium]|nr:1-acyl-sn-glycerol-3-phosphate acyltransferase [Thermoanaerobaculia bacterium]